MNKADGKIMYNWAKKLFPINRSVSAPGNEITLQFLRRQITKLKIKSFQSGKVVYGWKIPKQWHLRDAYIADDKNKKIIDFNKNNLHVLNYSQSIKKKISYKQLVKNLYFIKKQPTAIPYITSYYSKNWGFCLSYNQFKKLRKKTFYNININSQFKKGKMFYGEVFIKGRSSKEILLSTNICHPSMGNNETSGIVVTTRLAQWLENFKNRKYSYRILFIPETIGSIAYIQKNLNKLRKNVVAGFVVVCVGVKNQISYLASKKGNTLSDTAAIYTLKKNKKKFQKYSFFDRGSDERQFCSKKVELPVCSIMSSKYGEYKEYHTSLDNLNFISPEGLLQSYDLIKKTILTIEKNLIKKNKEKYYIKNISTNNSPLKINRDYKLNKIYKNIYNYPCEPKLSNYGLRKKVSNKLNYDFDKLVLNVLLLSDGKTSVNNISKILRQKNNNIYKVSELLRKSKLLKCI